MNVTKMSVLPKPAHRFNTVFIKSSVVFKEIEKNNILMEGKRFQRVKEQF